MNLTFLTWKDSFFQIVRNYHIYCISEHASFQQNLINAQNNYAVALFNLANRLKLSHKTEVAERSW